MRTTELVEKAINLVDKYLGNDTSGHDTYHALRVCNNALRIWEKEGMKGDREIIIIASLLHDLADPKTLGEEKGWNIIENFLKKEKVEKEKIRKIKDIILHISFSKGKVPSTIEGKIVQDADRLDALGAIGIARVFATSSKLKSKIHSYKEEDIKKGTAITHIYHKILKLKDKMNTESGKKMAEKKHKYVEQFVERFMQEWKIEKIAPLKNSTIRKKNR